MGYFSNFLKDGSTSVQTDAGGSYPFPPVSFFKIDLSFWSAMSKLRFGEIKHPLTELLVLKLPLLLKLKEHDMAKSFEEKINEYRDQEIRPFAISEDCIKVGFDMVMSNVDIPQNIKIKIYDHFLITCQAGDVRLSDEVFVTFLKDVDWSWDWYDECENIFKGFEAFPYMWREYVRNEFNAPLVPCSVTEGAVLFRLSDLRKWIKENNISLPSKPRKKTDYIKVLADEVTWEQFQDIAEKRHLEIIQKAKEKDLKGKAKLLCHTIQRTIYSARSKDSYADLFTSYDLVWGDDAMNEIVRLGMVGDEAPEIDQLTQTIFNDCFENGLGKWHPFFVGCRSSVRLPIDFYRKNFHRKKNHRIEQRKR